VKFGTYFHARLYLDGTSDASGNLTAKNGINVRFVNGNSFRLSLDQFSFSNVNGGVASVYGANLEEVTDVELWKGEVGAGTLVATVPAAWDVDNSCLNTDPIDEEGLAEQSGYLRVATDGGADTYPVSYYA
jgi:hypothetical protein